MGQPVSRRDSIGDHYDDLNTIINGVVVILRSTENKKNRQKQNAWHLFSWAA